MFTHLSTRHLDHLGITARHYRHSCGLEVISLECEDSENICAVSFRTIPHNSTGVEHILEHCVCEGTLHFPVKSPFVELERSSMATLLNAFTYNDFTVYPFATANPRDFFNIFEVYWDIAFHPTLKPEIFRQEGWHLGFQVPGDRRTRLIENGIVLNEMKAAMAELETIMEDELTKRLLPDSFVSLNSGGDPRHIVELTYEDFLTTYHEHYAPANARYLFCGNIPTEEKLAFIESHLAGCDTLQAPSRAVPPARRKTPSPRPSSADIPVSPSPNFPPDNQYAWGMSWLMDNSPSTKDKLVADLLDSILFDNDGAPLKKAILESGLAEDLAGFTGFKTDAPQLIFSIGATGLARAQGTSLKQIVMNVLKKLAEKGPSKEQLHTAFMQLKVDKYEIDNGYVYDLIDDIYNGWFHDGDPLANLDCRPLLEELEHELMDNPQILGDIIQKQILGNPQSVELNFMPDEKLHSRQAKEERRRLQAKKQSLSPEQLRAISLQQQELLALQQSQDSPEALATLPRLKRQEISPLPLPIDYTRLTDDRHIPILSDNCRTNGLHYLKLAFSLDMFTEEELKLLPFFVMMLNHLGTRRLDYAAFDDKLASYGADMEADYLVESPALPALSHQGLLTLKLSTLDEGWPYVLDCLGERHQETVFTESKRILELLRQRRARFRQDMQDDAHVFARLRASAGLTPLAGCCEYWYGLTHIMDCQKYATLNKQSLPGLVEPLDAMMSKLATASPLALAHVGPESARAELLARYGALPSAKPQPFNHDLHWTLPNSGRQEAFILPYDVGACFQAMKAPDFFSPDCAALSVFAELLGSGPVWDALRVQGGAYGAFCRYFPMAGILVLGSARDPFPAKSLNTIRQLLSRQYSWTSQEIDGAVVTQLKKAPPRPAAKCDWILDSEFTGLSFDIRAKHRQALLDVDSTQVAAVSEYIRDVAARESNICLAGNKAQLQNSQAAIIQMKA